MKKPNPYQLAREQQAREHWEFIGKIFEILPHLNLSKTEYIDLYKYLYTTAMVHGFKHGVESVNETRNT